VVEHRVGRLIGLKRIVGAYREPASGFPVVVPDVNFVDHTNPVSIVRITRRFVLYREQAVPAIPPSSCLAAHISPPTIRP